MPLTALPVDRHVDDVRNQTILKSGVGQFQLPVHQHSHLMDTPPTVIVLYTLGDSCIPLVLDTGGNVSLLNMATYEQFLSHLPLQPPSLSLYGYGCSVTDVLGFINSPMQYGNKALTQFPFHMTRQGTKTVEVESLHTP